MRRVGMFFLTTALIFGVMAPCVTAQSQRYLAITGKILDASGNPLDGYRVVFQSATESHSFHSGTTGPDGSYLISLPEGGEYLAVAVVTSTGRKTVLNDQAVLIAAQSATYDVRLGTTVAQPSPVAPIPSSSPAQATPVTSSQALEPVEADNMVTIRGKVTNLTGSGLADYRVVYYSQGEADVFISFPSATDGEYAVALPENEPHVPVALIAPSGSRIHLEGEPTVQATTGARHDIKLATDVPATAAAGGNWFPGGDRLFLSFVEDTVLPEYQRYEFQFDLSETDLEHRILSTFSASFQVPVLPDTSMGVKVGYGSLDLGASDESGATDVDIWAKLNVGDTRGGTSFAFGTLISLPLGDEESGLSTDAYSAELFGAMRKPLSFGSFKAHLGVRGTEDSIVPGFLPMEGQVSGRGGIGFTAEMDYNMNVVFEAVAESARFKDGDTAAQALVGINWQIGNTAIFRFAVAAGLADGAPDTQAIFGFAMEL
jgi:hypothetical protein